MFSLLLPYKNLILQASLCVTLTLITIFLKLHIRFLQGLFTYIHPDNVAQNNKQQGIRAAIRRPSSSDSSRSLDGYQYLSAKSKDELRNRTRSKQKYEFDESNAQIFRLKLDEAHLESRFLFYEYCYGFKYFIVGISCLLLQNFLDVSEESGIWISGIVVPIFLGFLGIFKLFVSLAKVSCEKSASKRSEKQLSGIAGVVGFLVGLLICLGTVDSIFDFRFRSFDGVGRFSVAVFMGCIAGFLYMPAGKCARSFWLGTDQLRWNLSIISCGWIARILLYASYLLPAFTSLLWINPLTEMLINKNIVDSKGGSSTTGIAKSEKLVGNVGMSRSDFDKLRLWCLMASGLVQIVALRSNLQMYLNEAVLSWYQRLHASKVPDLDYSRAKVFLHNHYLCLAVLQFFGPPAMVLLFLGLSQIESNTVEKFHLLCSLLPCSAFEEVALFMAWWVIFVWVICTSVILILYRRGIWYVS